MKKRLSSLCLLAVLPACAQQSEDNALTERRIAACREVMQTYIKQANIYERDRKRLVESCHISQKERSLEQWQCALAAMQKGTPYETATEQCKKGP